MPRALFECVSETRHAGGSPVARSYTLHPVIADDPLLNEFWTSAPSGTLELWVTNPDAFLAIGRRYYLDLSPAS